MAQQAVDDYDVAQGSDSGGEDSLNPEVEDNLGTYVGDRNQSNERDGFGVATHANGDVYEGQYSAGQRHGEGKYTWKNGEKYEGSYKHDKKHGLGSFTYANGGIYRGMWVNNRRHGDGTFFYPNKDTYTGEWRRGRKSGQGCYVFKATGCEFKGTFKNGKFVAGEWKMRDGTTYVGRFSRGIPTGQGIYKFPDGNAQKGKNRVVYPAPDSTPDGPRVPGDAVPERSWHGEEVVVASKMPELLALEQERNVALHKKEMIDKATQLFEALDSGSGPECVRDYIDVLKPAEMSCESGLPNFPTTILGYAKWLQDLKEGPLPDLRSEIQQLTSGERVVHILGVMRATHLADQGPVPPTNKPSISNFVYVMEFDAGNKVVHLTKVHDVKHMYDQLGWPMA
eukprot:gnl/Spiro4/20751_TR10106_c0_g1_i1.p1 gnl/Spiro4/20751_TR10106_c0_g1~~gnl/Spiro4/20751_TR10106_c0_g1_i1.p1  ORF type:complete len:405 (-),score=121.48 gnl/Spiro4/20751_TR10106_c0_g1_i1:124-1308(-)